MNRKLKNIKNGSFVSFDLFIGISQVLPLNTTNVFEATDATLYFKIIPIDIFTKNFVSDDL